MSRHYPFYLAAWATACVVALVLLAAGRGSFALARSDYWRFLATPVFDKVFWWALPLMALAAAMMVPFLWKYL